MTYLSYCIFLDPRPKTPWLTPGVDGQPVSIVGGNGLNAAVSLTDGRDLTADAPRILAYEKAIESFHIERTVVPMRYGCVFNEEAQIMRLLEDNHEQFQAALEELEGLVEMGVRVLIPMLEKTAVSTTAESTCRLAPSSSAPRAKAGAIVSEDSGGCYPESGRAYLLARRDRYVERDGIDSAQAVLSERICGRLSGLFVRRKQESSVMAGSVLLSLYFLVRGNGVKDFRNAFGDLNHIEGAKVLLSGPWPPYNFVQPRDLYLAVKESRSNQGMDSMERIPYSPNQVLSSHPKVP